MQIPKVGEMKASINRRGLGLTDFDQTIVELSGGSPGLPALSREGPLLHPLRCPPGGACFPAQHGGDSRCVVPSEWFG